MSAPWHPFLEYAFMQRALLGCVAISLGATPVGVFLQLRRMSLTGDAMAHAILPGAAIGFLLYGLSLAAMTVGGMLAGLVVALLTGAVSRATRQHEASALAALYLISLALGVLLVSLKGSSIDLMHVLFGSVLALDNPTLALLCGICSLTLLALALLYRPLVIECVDPVFLRTVSRWSLPVHLIFLALVVLNLVGGFQALGTLMAVGIMILPAAAAQFWVRRLGAMLLVAIAIAVASSLAGLLLSFHLGLPSGPSVILATGGCYLASLLFGPAGGLLPRVQRPTYR